VGGCDLPQPLHTSEALHLDDYVINETLSCLAHTVPIVPSRLNDLLRHSGMGGLSERNVALTKAEMEEPLAHDAQASMALARSKDLKENPNEPEPCLTTDTGWDHGRNGSHATTTFLSESSGRIVHEETTRRSDPDIKSSQTMEKIGFNRGIDSPILKAAGYSRIGMDGCCSIIKAAEARNYRCQGDAWHGTKCKGKHFQNHCDAHAPRCLPCATEKAAKAMAKPARPAGPAATVQRLGSSPAEPTPLDPPQMRERLVAAGEREIEDADIAKAYKALRQVEFSKARFSTLSFELPPRPGGSSLQAYADRLGSYFSIRARQAVYTASERKGWAAFDAFSFAQLEATALRNQRTARNATLKRERAAARDWENYFRTVYCFVFRYTASLRNTTNEATGQLWSNEERTREAQRLYPRAALSLAGGFLDDASLATIQHPATKKSETDFRWQPPDAGHIPVGGLAWEILESWVRDPQCLSKFKYYIDNISTAMNECFFSKKLKWLPKANHYVRFYRNGLCCAILDHNENVDRKVRAEVWMRGETLRKGGRWYTRKLRVASTDDWRGRILSLVLGAARARSTPEGAPAEEQLPTLSYIINDSAARRLEAARRQDAGAQLMGMAGAGDGSATADGSTAAVVVVGRGSTDEEAQVAGGIDAAVQDGPAELGEDSDDESDEEAEERDQPPVDTEAEANFARLLETATAATDAAANVSDGSATLVEYTALVASEVSSMKVEALKEHLLQRGLVTTGKKALLADRLLEWLADQEVERFEGDDEEGDDGEQTTTRSGRDPARLARAAGVSLQWHLVTCPKCSAHLMTRLQRAQNVVACSYCKVEFGCENRDIVAHPLPKPQPVKYRVRGPSARFRSFMSRTMRRLISERQLALLGTDPNVLEGRQQVGLFRQAMSEWALVRDSPDEVAASDDCSDGQDAAESPSGSGDAADIADPGAADEAMEEESATWVAERPQPILPTAIPREQLPKKKKRALGKEASTTDAETVGTKRPAVRRTPLSPRNPN
jgi:hypothetical protein